MWDFIAIAVVSGCLLEAYRVYAKSRQAGAVAGTSLEARVAALEKTIEGELENRLRALETVVSDADNRLRKDIESL